MSNKRNKCTAQQQQQQQRIPIRLSAFPNKKNRNKNVTHTTK